MFTLLGILLFLTSLFLILLVLIQRGRGGGLAGAFGGMGGQSAFGTKAGDLFTRITIGVAAFWIILCALTLVVVNKGTESKFAPGLGSAADSEGGTGGTRAPQKSGATDKGAAPKSGVATGAAEKPASGGAAEQPAGTPKSDSGSTAPEGK